MSEIIRAIKGINDVLPGAEEAFLDASVWDRVFATAQRILDGHGYDHVRLPLIEETALFARGIGEGTDIVAKEMYTFTDRGERSLTLRPEGTAGAVRAYVEHGLYKSDPIQKWWYAGPMFRAERPQKGRYRQFYQIGAEYFGVAEPAADAEMLLMLWRLCAALELTGVAVRINTLGDRDSRARYRETLRAYLHGRESELCDTCRQRIDVNPLRCLDCKNESCRRVAQDAPDIMGSVSEASRRHFDRMVELLTAAGVPWQRDPRLVRGLDYYTDTTFELTTTALGAQDAILGGGRYDELVQQLGGEPTPAIGFAAGVERLALLVSAAQVARNRPDLFIAPMPGTEARALLLADEVRRRGPWRVEVDVSGKRVKAQMRRADKLQARTALVLGEDELKTGRGKLKDLGVSSTADVSLDGASLHAALSSLGERQGAGTT